MDWYWKTLCLLFILMELRKFLKNIGKIIIDLGNDLSLKVVVSRGREVSDLTGHVKKKTTTLYKEMRQSG